MQRHNQDRKEHFALFSKSGFEDELRNAALKNKEPVLLFDLNDLSKEFE